MDRQITGNTCISAVEMYSIMYAEYAVKNLISIQRRLLMCLISES